jgi:hypothetical protein
MLPNMKTMDLNIADVERALCAEANHPPADMLVRNRRLRRARHLPQGGHGVNAPVARKQDFPTMMLGLVSSVQAKDVVAGYRRVRAFKLVEEFEATEDGGTRRREPSFNPEESLEDVLLKCFDQCSLNPSFRLRELRVDHSAVDPKTFLTMDWYENGFTTEGPTETYQMVFAGHLATAEHQPEAREYSMRLREHALMTMVKLYAINNQLPPANETGPSAVTDEPGSMIPETLKDRRRATTRKRSKST